MKTLHSTPSIPTFHRKPRLYGKKKWTEEEIQEAKRSVHALLEEMRRLNLKPLTQCESDED